MGYVDLSTLHTPIGGARPPASYGRQIEANFDHLASPPRCGLSRSAVQAIPTSTWTAVLWTDEDYDVGPLHSTVTNTSRVTIPTGLDGLWRFDTNIGFDLSATGVRALGFRKNGTGTDPPTDGQVAGPNPGAADWWMGHLGRDIEMDEDDWMEVVVAHEQGADLNVVVQRGTPTFTARWVALPS